MAIPRVVVLRAAGMNCDAETAYAFELAGAQVQLLHVNQFTRGYRDLNEFEILALPGGFTYGDDISAGKILANEIQCLMQDQVEALIARGGLVIGICNGFQVLVKAGLLPGAADSEPSPAPRPNTSSHNRQSVTPDAHPQSVTLAANLNGRFQCRWIRLLVHEAASTPFLKGLDGAVLEIPIAHGEGRFVAPGPVLESLQQNRQIAFQYCGPAGELEDQYNVNGSMLHAAGISGCGGQVLGLMPHPERHVHGIQHPRWTRDGLREEGQGLAVFRNAVQHLS